MWVQDAASEAGEAGEAPPPTQRQNCSGEVAAAYINTKVGAECGSSDPSGANLIAFGYSKVGVVLPPNASAICASGAAAPAANFRDLTSGWLEGDVACFTKPSTDRSGATSAGVAAVGGYVRGGAIGAGSVVVCNGKYYERVGRTSTSYNFWVSHFSETKRLCGS